MEAAGRDRAVAVRWLAASRWCCIQPPTSALPRCSPIGQPLAWLEWQQPFMPWEIQQLWWATLAAKGSLEQVHPIAGTRFQIGVCSLSSRCGCPNGDLVVANDRRRAVDTSNGSPAPSN